MIEENLNHRRARLALSGFALTTIASLAFGVTTWFGGAGLAWAALAAVAGGALVGALLGVVLLIRVKLALDYQRAVTSEALHHVRAELDSRVDQLRRHTDAYLDSALDREREASKWKLESLERRRAEELERHLCQERQRFERDLLLLEQRSTARLDEGLDQKQREVEELLASLREGVRMETEAAAEKIQDLSSRTAEAVATLGTLVGDSLVTLERLELGGTARSKAIERRLEKTSQDVTQRIGAIQAELSAIDGRLQEGPRAWLEAIERRFEETSVDLTRRIATAEADLSALAGQLKDGPRAWAETTERRFGQAFVDLTQRIVAAEAELSAIERQLQEGQRTLAEAMERRLEETSLALKERTSSAEEESQALSGRVTIAEEQNTLALEGLNHVREELANQASSIETQLATTRADLSGRLDSIEERHSQEAAAFSRAISTERSQRIVGFARRDGSLPPPRKLLLILSTNRVGSTWLLDAVRCHPRVRFEPTSRVFEDLGVKKTVNRYPLALTDDGEGLEFELRHGLGAIVPRFQAEVPSELGAELEKLEPVSIEKLHPEFFDWKAQQFARRLARFEREHDARVELIYRLRDPLESMISMLEYKRRDPNWYTALDAEEVPAFFARSLETLEELSRLRPGFVSHFEDHMDRSPESLIAVFRWLWPNLSAPVHELIAAQADQITNRELRRARTASNFFVASPSEEGASREDDGPPATPAEELIAQDPSAIDRCYKAYRAIAEERAEDVAERTRRTAAGPGSGPSRLEPTGADNVNRHGLRKTTAD